MKIKLALFRTTSGSVHVSQYVDDKDTWLHSDEVRVTEILEVDFPERSGAEVQIDIEGMRTRALEKIRRLEGKAA